MIKNYLLSISSAALLMSVISLLVPKGRLRGLSQLMGAMLLTLSVLSPLVKIKYDDIAQAIAKQQMEYEQMQSGIEINNREILSELIKERSQTYILDKAADLGIVISADITLSEEGGYPYPIAVEITGHVSNMEKQYLSKIIEEDLGIPKEQQEWK